MENYIQDYLAFGWNGLTDFIIPFLIILSILVFVHEWGHYIVARWCGVKVDVFSIGFGKELFGWNDSNGTRWKVSLIPLGGYVQMYGDTDPSSSHSKAELLDDEKTRPMTEKEKSEAFFAKSVWQRAAIVFAGPAINFIFAILILSILYSVTGKPVTPPIAAAVMVDGAAFEAGIKPHDRIVAIDGEQIQSFTDIQRQVAISLNRQLTLSVARKDGTQEDIIVNPRIDSFEDRFGFSQSRGMIGIMSTDKAIEVASLQSINGRDVTSFSQDRLDREIQSIIGQNATIGLPSADGNVSEVRANIVRHETSDGDNMIFLTDDITKEIVEFAPTKAVGAALEETWFIITGTLEAIGQIFTGTRSATELGGIVRIGAIAGDAVQNGLIAAIVFTALLSINLGLINLFPIPLLDGGHLVFYTYEAIFKKPMSEKVMDYALKFGMVFLIGLMAFANINDIVQIIL